MALRNEVITLPLLLSTHLWIISNKDLENLPSGFCNALSGTFLFILLFVKLVNFVEFFHLIYKNNNTCFPWLC